MKYFDEIGEYIVHFDEIQTSLQLLMKEFIMNSSCIYLLIFAIICNII